MGPFRGPDFGPKVRTESEIRTFQKNGLSSIPTGFNMLGLIPLSLCQGTCFSIQNFKIHQSWKLPEFFRNSGYCLDMANFKILLRAVIIMAWQFFSKG